MKALYLRPVVLALLLLAGSVAGAQNPAVIRNADVVKMTRAGLSDSIILATIESANVYEFDISVGGLLALAEAGVSDRIILAVQARARHSEGSDSLAGAKDPDAILRLFKTMTVDAAAATFFATDQMKAALGANKDFGALNIVLVDNPAVADVMLRVGYTFAWDYPFSLAHRDTSAVLLTGFGSGPFSGPLGAESVASEVVKLLKPYRATTRMSKPRM